MFTTFDLIISYPVPTNEREEYDYLLANYAATPQGRWLNNIAWRGFELKYCQKMADSSIMGAYLVAKPMTVYLMPSSATALNDPICNPNGRPNWPECIITTLIHELYHAWQYRRCKWLYVLCCLPGLRQITLERDAWKITRQAEKFFVQFNANRAAREFEERIQ